MGIHNALNPAQGVRYLVELVKESYDLDYEIGNTRPVNYSLIHSWQRKVEDVIKRTFHSHDVPGLLEQFRSINFQPARRPRLRRYPDQPSWSIALDKAGDFVKVLIVDLQLEHLGDNPLLQLGNSLIDDRLWHHVEDALVNERWGVVASQTTIYVEDAVRKWCGNPTDHKGKKLTAYALFSRVFGDSGNFRLGGENEVGEQDGWRDLTAGFARALGNDVRHNISRREDVKKYAMGVLGMGSLILTQLKHQHADRLALPKRPKLAPSSL